MIIDQSDFSLVLRKIDIFIKNFLYSVNGYS